MQTLLDAYKTTRYRVFELPITIEIGRKCGILEDLLRENQIAYWAYVTAWNPFSEVLSAMENEVRHARLLEVVRSFPHWEGEGVGLDPAWKPERSVLILGINREEAAALGRRFEQHAIVVGRLGEEAELLWLSDARK